FPVGLVDATRGRVGRRDRSLDVIRGDHGAGGRAVQPGQPLFNQVSVPPATCLLEQRIEIAGGIGARRQTRGVETHQRRECICFRRGGRRKLEQQEGQANRLAAQLTAHGGFSGGAVIPLVEEQVERATYRRQSRRQVGVGQIEQTRGAGEDFLASRNAFLHRRPAGEKRARHFGRSESA